MNFAINAALTGRDRTRGTLEMKTETMRPAKMGDPVLASRRRGAHGPAGGLRGSGVRSRRGEDGEQGDGDVPAAPRRPCARSLGFVTAMRFGVALGRMHPSMFVTAVDAAEALGFESVWFPEHLVLPVHMAGSPFAGVEHPPVPPSTPVFDSLAYLSFLRRSNRHDPARDPRLQPGVAPPLCRGPRAVQTRRCRVGRPISNSASGRAGWKASGRRRDSTSRHGEHDWMKPSRSAAACGPSQRWNTTAASSTSGRSCSSPSRTSGPIRRCSSAVSRPLPFAAPRATTGGSDLATRQIPSEPRLPRCSVNATPTGEETTPSASPSEPTSPSSRRWRRSRRPASTG